MPRISIKRFVRSVCGLVLRPSLPSMPLLCRCRPMSVISIRVSALVGRASLLSIWIRHLRPVSDHWVHWEGYQRPIAVRALQIWLFRFIILLLFPFSEDFVTNNEMKSTESLTDAQRSANRFFEAVDGLTLLTHFYWKCNKCENETTFGHKQGLNRCPQRPNDLLQLSTVNDWYNWEQNLIECHLFWATILLTLRLISSFADQKSKSGPRIPDLIRDSVTDDKDIDLFRPTLTTLKRLEN